jgi:glycosyl transferase family 25
MKSTRKKDPSKKIPSKLKSLRNSPKRSIKKVPKSSPKKSPNKLNRSLPKKIKVLSHRVMKRYKSPAKSSRSPKAKSVFNRFFDKIFIINLKDSPHRLKKVAKEYRNKHIKFDVFEAINGRCKKVSICKQKQKTFSERYGVQYGNRIANPKERVPASSLTLSQRLIYMETIRQGWERVLISEDDVWLTDDVEKRFKQAIKELPDDWDMLYLGCGAECGVKGISEKKTKRNKYLTDLAEHYDVAWHVSVKEDLRSTCDDCKIHSSQLTIPEHPGGTWNYAVSNKGARKLLEIMGNRIGQHCDKIYPVAIAEGKIKAYALDPPVIYHEAGAFRADSAIPWKW